MPNDTLWPIGEDCPTVEFLRVMGGKWKPLVVFALHAGPVRFGELARRLDGITPRTLTRQLRELEQDGILVRTVVNPMPPHVEYSLSKWGETVLPVIEAMVLWGADGLRARGGSPITDCVGRSGRDLAAGVGRNA